jgi:hypothetical protein
MRVSSVVRGGAEVETTCLSANFQRAMYRIEDVRFDASGDMGPFFEARCCGKDEGSYIFIGVYLSAVHKKNRFKAFDVGCILSLLTS